MFVYLLTQDTVRGWDTYDSMVVIAESEEAAKRIHPWEGVFYNESIETFCFHRSWDPDNRNEVYHGDTWPHNLSEIKVERIGVADENSKPGVVCASFNAG